MNNPETIVVATREDLKCLLSQHTIHLLPSRHRRIFLRLEALSAEENEAWAKRVDALYFACGCGTGSLFLLFGMLAYVLYLLAMRRSVLRLLDILVGLGLAFLLSVLGKTSGLVLAKIRLRSVVRQILRRV